MELIPLKSRLIKKNDDLMDIVKESLKSKKERLIEGDILVIASKALAYSQGHLVSSGSKKEFTALIRREADRVLEEGEMVITLKNKILIPNAGIDNSNTPKGQVILWPEDPFEDARQIRQELMKEFKLSHLGVLISDSHCQPLRMGTSGIAFGWAGFQGVQDERGKKDLFGKKMTYTRIAVADNLASSANLLMGETDASIPFVIVRNFKAKWTDKKNSADEYFIQPSQCIYKGLYNKKLLK